MIKPKKVVQGSGARKQVRKKRGGSAAGKQGGIVMKDFYAGKLRDPSGRPITSLEQAKAVASSEARAAKSRGVAKRTFKGRTRIRPKLKKNGRER